jgi:hypothetical protein
MRNLRLTTIGLMLWQSAAVAQTARIAMPAFESSAADNGATGVLGSTGALTTPEYVPLTASERWKLYFVGAFGPKAIVSSAAAGGIRQWENSPKDWKGGAEAYGERFGNSYAEHIIRGTIEFGGATAMHEDNRYFRSTETGFWRRSKHALTSVFVARNNAGREHFAYSRFGSAVGTSFISRIWQPPSTNTSGDAAVNFGVTIGIDAGWNVFREFWPDLTRHFKRH